MFDGKPDLMVLDGDEWAAWKAQDPWKLACEWATRDRVVGTLLELGELTEFMDGSEDGAGVLVDRGIRHAAGRLSRGQLVVGELAFSACNSVAGDPLDVSFLDDDGLRAVGRLVAIMGSALEEYHRWSENPVGPARGAWSIADADRFDVERGRRHLPRVLREGVVVALLRILGELPAREAAWALGSALHPCGDLWPRARCYKDVQRLAHEAVYQDTLSRRWLWDLVSFVDSGLRLPVLDVFAMTPEDREICGGLLWALGTSEVAIETWIVRMLGKAAKP